jgi:hypothetical protein
MQGFAILQEVSWSRSSFSLAMLRSSPVGGNEISSRVARDTISSNPVRDSFRNRDYTPRTWRTL